MRKIIVSEFVTLDGVMEGPGPDDSFAEAGWTVPYVSEAFLKFKREELFAGGALLMGGVTYQGFSKAWPSMKDEAGFADRMNSLPKYVVSMSLKNPAWNNTRTIASNIPEEIIKLKEEAGQDILVFGSSILMRALMEHHLVDEYRLLVYPLVLGHGKRLFADGAHATLKLIEERAIDKGVLLLRYQPNR